MIYFLLSQRRQSTEPFTYCMTKFVSTDLELSRRLVLSFADVVATGGVAVDSKELERKVTSLR